MCATLGSHLAWLFGLGGFRAGKANGHLEVSASSLGPGKAMLEIPFGSAGS